MLAKVYLGLGGNIGNTVEIIRSALDHIGSMAGVEGLLASGFYKTSPVSDIPQAPYVNAACVIFTTMSPAELFERLQAITLLHGQGPKPKNAPRLLDIDILHYGDQPYIDELLEIPHPRWSERLFVLTPLLDLTDSIECSIDGQIVVYDLIEMIKKFSNKNNETIQKLEAYAPYSA